MKLRNSKKLSSLNILALITKCLNLQLAFCCIAPVRVIRDHLVFLLKGKSIILYPLTFEHIELALTTSDTFVP